MTRQLMTLRDHLTRKEIGDFYEECLQNFPEGIPESLKLEIKRAMAEPSDEDKAWLKGSF